MKIFSTTDYPQGSPGWWELRRGLPTASGADRIIQPKMMKPSAQRRGYIAELIGDLVSLSPNWFTENHFAPPNRAIEEGQAREQESRDWFALSAECEVACVGFCLSDCGRMGFSPDGLIEPKRDERGNIIGSRSALELKNPLPKTQAEYLMDGPVLPDAYKCQCHFQLLVGGYDYIIFCSYAPPLPPLVVEVRRGKFTEALGEAVEQFHEEYRQARQRLGLPDGLFQRQEPKAAVAADEPTPF